MTVLGINLFVLVNCLHMQHNCPNRFSQNSQNVSKKESASDYLGPSILEVFLCSMSDVIWFEDVPTKENEAEVNLWCSNVQKKQ